jgi:tRNA A37 threonylcarbamoyladenosine modification protein TsaB
LKLEIDTTDMKKTIVNGTVYDGEKRASEVLLPLIDEIISGSDDKKIEHISVKTVGESYTGIRVGIATALGLSLARDIPTSDLTATYIGDKWS